MEEGASVRAEYFVAWQLLQRLNQIEAAVIWNATAGRYHFLHHCRVMDPVHIRTFNVLTSEGYLTRERSAIPVFTITEKGREALKHREAPKEFECPEITPGGVADEPARGCR
jgi:CTP-dependent riboflavin kinase